MSDTPQFGTAEYQSQSTGESCKTCGAPITGQYFLINGAVTCSPCAERTGAALPKDTHAAFTRGILFGIGGAIIGLILYSVVGIVTGLEIGYVSLAVGYIVGRAVLLGTSGIGGRRQQIAAAVLTYAAVSMASVPVFIWHMTKEAGASNPAVVTSAETVTAEAEATEATEATEETEEATATDSASPGIGRTLIFLAMLGLASPFLGLMSPLSGLIGLVILFVGIRIAWQMTGNAVQITGPHNA
jgi:predicted lipid-binding transport protein (Tim44 family)